MTTTTKQYDFKSLLTKSTFLRIVGSIDNQITRNLRHEGIEPRPSKSNGLWCCALLPTILVIYSLQYQVSLLYGLLACISIGILCYCILFITFLSVSCQVLTQRIAGGCATSSLLSALLMYGALNQYFVFSLIYSGISIYSFSALLKTSIKMFPKTFTIGESIIVTQGFVLFLMAVVLRLLYNIGDVSDDEMEFVNSVNMTILTSVGIIVTALVVLGDTPTDFQTFSTLIAITGTVALVMLHISLGIDCIITIASYLIFDVVKIKLFTFWCAISGVTGIVLVIRTKTAVKASTETRKVFHILASIVFISGIIGDVHLMTFAAGFGLGVVILAEALRKSNVEIISNALESAFQVFSDEKDAGCFAMTPIYLYVGLACPLILVPVHKGYELELLSGVLSIGIGDTAASWFGAKYGAHKWPGSRKSFEGTGFNIVSQMATIYLLDMLHLLNVKYGLLRTVVAAIISGWIEAKTDQIDNLVLPLVTIIAFQLTWFL